MMAEDVKAASDAVRSAIESTNGPLPPPFVVEFLLRHWRRYLALTHSERGPDSEEWHAACHTTERLLWSVAPKSSADERVELIRAIKALLAELRHGMQAENCPAAEQSVFLQRLSDWHLGLVNLPGAAHPGAGAKPQERDLSDTFRLDLNDPRYRQIMDMLDNANVEQIDM
ncbi:MAG: DUF1631 family protein [Gammaproteobacteria bacterium]